MKKCANCGADNQDNRRWCRNCMKELPDALMLETKNTLSEAKESEARTSRLSGSMGKNVYGKPEEHTAGDKTQSPVSGFASSDRPANSPNTMPNAKSNNQTVSKLSGSIGSKRYTSEEQIPESHPNNSNFKGNLVSSTDSYVPVQPKKKVNCSHRKKKFNWKAVGIASASIAVILLLTAGLYWGWSAISDGNKEVVIIVPDDLTISSEDVSYGEEGLYVDSQIVLVTDTRTSFKTVEELVSEKDGEIIGHISFSGDYQIAFPGGKTYEELSDIINIWKKEPYIEMVSLNHAYETDIDSIDYTDDPWKNTSTRAKNTEWSEESPSGNNWWAEAIKMPSVWAMEVWNSPDTNSMKVGVIDSVFAEKNKDLDDVIVKTWQNEFNITELSEVNLNHGTHVTGLIAAEVGNNVGIAGVAGCAGPELHCFSFFGTKNSTFLSDAMSFKYAIALMLEKEVSIINISMGPDMSTIIAAQLGNSEAQNDIAEFDKAISDFLRSAISTGYDFLIIKSAGNASGYFTECEIDEKNGPYGYKKVSEDTPNAHSITCSANYNWFAGISDPEVREHIIIVGAAQLDTTSRTGYSLGDFSCIDADIYAPGVGILSTAYGDTDTCSYSGTSMSAPIVTGIATLVWSVNPNMSSEQVRAIVLESAAVSEQVHSNVLEDTGKEVMVPDAAEAVHMALNETGENANVNNSISVIMGTVYQIIEHNGEETKESVSGAVVTVCSNDAEETVKELIIGDESSFELFLPVGGYSVSVKADGFITHTVSFELCENDTKYLSIRLYPEQKEPLDSYTNFSSGKRLVQINRYNNHDIDNECKFSYNEKGLLTSVALTYIYSNGHSSDGAKRSFEYDSQGRLVKLYEGDNASPIEEYEYNSSGSLVKRISYDVTYSYEYNNAGQLSRIISDSVYSHSITDYQYDQNGMRVGALTTCEWYVTEEAQTEQTETTYTYDSEGRLIKEVMSYLSYDLEDSITTYCYDYKPFVLCENNLATSGLSLNLYDGIGNQLWSETFQNLKLVSDNDGYAISGTTWGTTIAQDDYYAALGFVYDDTETDSTVGAYIPIVEKAIAEEMYLPQGNGMLYDMDGDGVQELIMIHQKSEMDGDVCIDAYYACSVYGLENGQVYAKMDELYMNSMAGAPESYAGIVEYNGEQLFLVHTSNTGDGSSIETDVLYGPDFSKVLLTLEKKTDWDYVADAFVAEYSFQINGIDCSGSEYESTQGAIEFVDMIDDGYGSMSAYTVSRMSLNELLNYLKANT